MNLSEFKIIVRYSQAAGHTVFRPIKTNMRDLKKVRLEIERLKTRLRAGDRCAESNLAATYRELGNRRRAFYWWARAVAKWRDGDDYLELGYCYQYGLGVRRNHKAAVRNYRRAIRSTLITEYGREEAMYHLAIALLDRGGDASVYRQAIELLHDATIDEDYPEALDLLCQAKSKGKLNICRCRRGLRRSLGGKAQCPFHRGQTRRRLV